LLPKLVNKEDTSDFSGIRYMGLSVVTIKANQEQQEIIEALKAKIEALENG